MWVLGPDKVIETTSNRYLGCLYHQRKAYPNIMPLSGSARYQWELNSRSLESAMSSCSSPELWLPWLDSMSETWIARGWTAEPFLWEDAFENAGKGHGRTGGLMSHNRTLQTTTYSSQKDFLPQNPFSRVFEVRKTGMHWFLILVELPGFPNYPWTWACKFSSSPSVKLKRIRMHFWKSRKRKHQNFYLLQTYTPENIIINLKYDFLKSRKHFYIIRY